MATLGVGDGTRRPWGYDGVMSKTPAAKSTPAPRGILDLVQRFAQHQETYKQQTYNETQVRREFIDPLFVALGWDVDTARVKYITYDQYADRWAEIADIFSKDAILQGSFDKYAASNRRKRGTAEVDTEFLTEIERWRELLARNIALRNPGLSVRELNYAVGKTIDRLIFLRMCEDRGVETYAQLRALLNGDRATANMLLAFVAAWLPQKTVSFRGACMTWFERPGIVSRGPMVIWRAADEIREHPGASCPP